MSRPEKQRGYIYFLLSEKANAIKIGFTRNAIENRLRHGSTWSPYEYDVLKVVEGSMVQEKLLHKRFVKYKIRGEWFEYSEELKQFIDQL